MEAIALRTLVLSQGYEPLKVVSWKRAINLLFLGKVELVEEYDQDIRSTSLVIKCPAVVRLLNAFRRHKKGVRFNRINIFARDRYSCQYCGKKGKIADLTYDHVIPRSQGGKTEWTNITTACSICNGKKGGRTPQQAGMRLRIKPYKPSWVPAITLRFNRKSIPESWATYLYWNQTLLED